MVPNPIIKNNLYHQIAHSLIFIDNLSKYLKIWCLIVLKIRFEKRRCYWKNEVKYAW